MTPSLRHELVGQPEAPRLVRIAHLSDFHLWVSDRKLRQLEPRLAAWRPDVLALTGDYADTPLGQRLALAWIERMTAVYSVCWVAGNHDHWWGGQFLRRLEALPRAHAIDRRDAWIAGRTGRYCRFTSWAGLGRTVPSVRDAGPSVVLLHDPAVIEPDQLQTAGAGLVLAGHLHGGQINLWHDAEGRPQPASRCYRWLGDRREIDRASLIVSRGLGDTLPIRIQASPEVVMIDYHDREADHRRSTIAARHEDVEAHS